MRGDEPSGAPYYIAHLGKMEGRRAGTVVYAYNLNTPEVEIGGLQVPG
jgi:hypothetical protein